jgi:carboxyl-terminal processing protease
LEEALERSAAFFLYANRFAAEHDDLPAGFSVDAARVADFRRWVESQGSLRYHTRAERIIDDLERDLDGARYDGADDELAELRSAVAREKAGDFERHAARIRVRLRDEILSRYVGRADAVRTALADDPQLEAALAILAEPGRFGRMLGR